MGAGLNFSCDSKVFFTRNRHIFTWLNFLSQVSLSLLPYLDWVVHLPRVIVRSATGGQWWQAVLWTQEWDWRVWVTIAHHVIAIWSTWRWWRIGGTLWLPKCEHWTARSARLTTSGETLGNGAGAHLTVWEDGPSWLLVRLFGWRVLQVTDKVSSEFKLIWQLLLKSLDGGNGLLELELLHHLLLEYLLLNASTLRMSIKLDPSMTTDTYSECLVGRRVVGRLGASCQRLTNFLSPLE